MANTMKFLERMLTVFLARQKPDSTSAKPRFMKNTSDAVISTQTVSRAMVSSSGVLVAAPRSADNPSATIENKASHDSLRMSSGILSPEQKNGSGEPAGASCASRSGFSEPRGEDQIRRGWRTGEPTMVSGLSLRWTRETGRTEPARWNTAFNAAH